MKIRRIIIITKPTVEVRRVGADLITWFENRQIHGSMDPAFAAEADLAVVIGGDGTLLAAARLLGERQVPILAINHGSLGFMTEVTLDELYPALDRVLEGRFITEERMMMDMMVAREGSSPISFRALNDVVINKGTISRVIELEVRVDDQYVSTFRADGLIVASPTGSTAYNLSAGGPIIFPTMGAMVVTPICSHTLTNRPIVLPEGVTVQIILRSTQDEVHVTVDGQVGQRLEMGDGVVIRKSKVAVKLVAPMDKNYFDVLRGKLKWG